MGGGVCEKKASPSGDDKARLASIQEISENSGASLLLASCGTYGSNGTGYMIHGHTWGSAVAFPTGFSRTGLVFLASWSLCMCA